MLWCAAQISACLHSATATKEKHAHATQGQIILSECCLHITSKKGLGITQHKNPDYLHAQFSIWMDQSGTAGLNKSAVATGFTHDFPACVPPLPPVSCSHRFCAGNTNSRGEKRHGSRIKLCVFVFLYDFYLFRKTRFFARNGNCVGCTRNGSGEEVRRFFKKRKITKFRSKCSFVYVCFLHFWSLYM